MQGFEHYIGVALNYIATYAPKLVLAIVTLIVGLWVIGGLKKLVKKSMEKKDIDKSLRNFLTSLFSVLLKVLLVISVISMVGVETTSFIAIIGAAGLAIGLALQGSLANFAGGALILILKPFKTGDYIESMGHAGTVNNIQVFHTELKTPDNKTIILPNGPVANNDIVNYSTEDTRRIDFAFGIGYSDDISKAKELLNKIIAADNRILKDPAPLIAVGELADSSVNITTRVWCKKEEYWNIYFDMFEKVKTTFDANGISIPFPQRDLHLFNEK
jgi:small conductance mechanosensitive channel